MKTVHDSLLGAVRVSFLSAAVVVLGGCSDLSSSPDVASADQTAADHAQHSDSSHDHSHDHGDHAGHDHDHGDHAATTPADSGVRTDIYEDVMGELTFIPTADQAKMHPKVRHVQIPTFKRQDGTVAVTPDGIPGMRSMTMDFPLAEGMSLDGYSAGDKIKFSFRVNWGGRVAWEMTSIEKIDPATELDYSNVTVDAIEASEDQEP
ncbi:MAG: copper-binding protein [Phycisphaerales bacterium]